MQIKKWEEKVYKINNKNQVADQVYKTEIEGLYYISRPVNRDERGLFNEIAVISELEKAIGYKFKTKQINHARSKQNVIRGFHAEGWNKLVTVINGLSYCVLVDVRKTSKTYKQSQIFLLGEADKYENYHGTIYVEKGIANSVCVIEGPLDYIYNVDRLYSEREEKDNLAINLFDEQIGVEWPISKEEMIVSQRDKESISISDYESV